MKITKEKENRYLVLFSIIKQNGKVTKNQVLDYLEENNFIILSSDDKLTLVSRNELKWRNELAFVRSHLVSASYLNNKERNFWEITEKGKKYFYQLHDEIKSGNTRRINDSIILSFNSLNDQDLLRSQTAKELFEDNTELENEIVSRKIEVIKRYQGIVTMLKKKYDSKCQISTCDFTFKKSDGSNYSEGHHLVPLSQNGKQDESNLVILCANHHRMFHYTDIDVMEKNGNKRIVTINGIEHLIVYK